MQHFQRVYNNVRHLDGAGPSPINISRIDHGSLPMLHSMMRTGMRVDLDHFAKLEKTLVDDMSAIDEWVKDETGHYCNLNSGDQKADLLFTKLGLKQAHPKRTKGDTRESVEDAVLVAIQHDHPIVPKILEFNELSKLLGTYVRPMPKLAQKVGFGHWRMFPKLTHTRVPSGRFACKEPNLLAMPTRTERGREIRVGFIADPGWVFISCDLSQIEPRIAAHRSKDPNLLRIYRNGEDIYSDFAIAAFKLKDERYFDKEAGKWKYPYVSSVDHRRPSKTCVLAALYDVTGKGLLEQMPIMCSGCNLEATKHTCSRFRPLWNENNCDQLITSFYLRYPHLIKMRKIDHKNTFKYGYMWDDWGRLLHVAAVYSVLPWVVSAALREVGNYPIQAAAAGCLKLAMAAVHDDIEDGGLMDLVKFHLPIHDEILSSAREDIAEEVGSMIAGRFESCVRLDVPIKAGTAMADTWGALDKG